jgi:hypothetical protein
MVGVARKSVDNVVAYEDRPVQRCATPTKPDGDCASPRADDQPFPRSGPFLRRMNRSLGELRAALPADAAEVYAYVVATIGRDGERFVQYGSAPNWQGGVLTLCTCKHYMRSSGTPDDWRGRWVAGFSGVKAGDGRNALVFLARVGAAYDSQAALWWSNALGVRARNARVSTRHRHGDLFEPKSAASDQYRPRAYHTPCRNHDHFRDRHWYGDIDYVGVSGRRPSLLVGEVAQTYLWDRPSLFLTDSLGRGQQKHRLDQLMEMLKER